MAGSRRVLFHGRAGGDHATVWLEADGSAVVIRTDEWGAGLEHALGSESIETWLRVDGRSLATLVAALVMERPELDPVAPAIDVLAAAYAGDSAASAHARQALRALDLPFEFHIR
jgi:hypothetical protein